MGSIDDISQLCRLCLVKDQVNIPIFDGTSDIGQTFIKIESCLPVKVSRNDNLPKKICDGCSYKLDMLYTFRNTSIDSEKQLIQWLNQAGLSTISQTTTVKDPLASTTKPEIMVKQENFDTTDSRVDGDNPDLVDPQSFMIQQDHLGYEQEFVDFGEASGSNANDDSLTDEPAPKRAKRAAALKKAPLDDETEDDLDAAMQITKAEEEDEEEVDQPEYVEAPSTSADDQPGPSGVGKATTEAPLTITLGEGETVVYQCAVCSKEYPTRLQCLKHSYQHKEKTFLCQFCSKKFSYYRHLAKHISSVHQKVKNFFCEYCTFSTHTKDILRFHVNKIHIKNYRHKCDQCSSCFYSPAELREHVKFKHEGVHLVCPHCQKLFSASRSLKVHLKKHLQQELVECEFCPKIFSSKGAYNVHKKRHTGEASRFVCDECGKDYAAKEGLENHKKSAHNGERDWVCETCGRKFFTRSILREHMYTHGREKKFKCEICSKDFRKNSDYLRHVKSVHEKDKDGFTCFKCCKVYSSEKGLQRHKCLADINNF